MPQRRSSRIESRQRSVSIPHHESQSPLKQRSTIPQPSTISQPARLTTENLKAFEKMERAKRKSEKVSKSKLSQFSVITESFNSETKLTRSKQFIFTTDTGFHGAAFDNGILDPSSSKSPTNLKSCQEHINRGRDTASPSESEYEKFVHKIQTACNKQTVVLQTSQLLKEYDKADMRYSKVYNQVFNAFPKNIGFNNRLSAPQPDMVEGLEMPEFDPFPVRQQLDRAAVPTPSPHTITLPHLAGEWKGPGKDMRLAQTQAAYDGACMVYSRNKALSFLNNPDPAGYAHVQTFTTDGTILNTFAHYSSESQGQVKYHQCLTSSSVLILSYEDFKTGRRRLRNLQDNAKETSEKLRDELKKRWSANHRSSVAPSVPAKTADVTDKDSNNLPTNDQSNKRGQKRTRQTGVVTDTRRTRRKH